MTSEVVLTDDAKEDLRELDGSARKLVLKALTKLKQAPEQRGASLVGVLATFRKLVIGDRDYGIVYRVETDGTVVVGYVIGKRTDGEAYELARSRLALHHNQSAAQAVTELLDRAYNREAGSSA
ncbi:type II toxin-antitoxin system RelE family toxin [Haloactinomyces albus]|uniref:mRNA interferase RelE/StbE n=1 Tax=Haloactinomyces albus TaxID=1352928 RepID=A0AAE4CM49_9ACTN|nr:type II toxin-antitoxin system RelE/ParE family toxin [Haloactinomyces albus]MDR7300612.1 mRNA interferase RelE/StbE [Haloactinomyces albus]